MYSGKIAVPPGGGGIDGKISAGIFILLVELCVIDTI
jgi:hypothetical protein